MTVRRWGAAAVVAALVWWVVSGSPAQAAAPSGGISSPTADAVVTTNTPLIQGSYSQPGGGRVDEVAVIVQSAEGHGSWSKVFPGNGTSSLSFSFQVPELAYNGRYRAQSQAKGTDALDTNGQETSGISVRDFSVAVPPVSPTGLRATSNTSKQQVSLTWNANPEPDMLGYELQRQGSSSSKWTVVAQNASTSAVDPVPSPGTWKYRLVAIRAGASSSEGVASEPSASVSTTVDAPPTTTTSTITVTNDGGSTGGASTGAGGSSSGSTSGGGSGGSGSTTSSDKATARAGRVDLSGYAALLDANRRQLRTTPTTEYDPGYSEMLPFQPVTEEIDDEPEGGKSVEIGFSRTTVPDDGAQRRKMAYYAGGLLAFVLAMHGWFIRTEVRRQDELEALDATPDGADLTGGVDPDGTEVSEANTSDSESGGRAPEVLVPSVVTATSAAARAHRRARRAERRRGDGDAGSSEGDDTSTVSTEGADKGGRSARRAARRVPPRPRHDRSEGGPAVRARARRAGGGDRRPAV